MRSVFVTYGATLFCVAAVWQGDAVGDKSIMTAEATSHGRDGCYSDQATRTSIATVDLNSRSGH